MPQIAAYHAIEHWSILAVSKGVVVAIYAVLLTFSSEVK